MMTPASHHAMETWSPRHATSLIEARRRTAIVHIIRVLFTSGAVIAAGLLMGSIINHAFSGANGTLQSATTNVTILNPRFEGRDSQDRPYVIIADTARRRPDDVSVVDLTNPRLSDELDNTVDARDGVFNRDSQELELVGGVVMRDTAGYTFTTERAKMYVRENRIVGETELRGVGPIGEVRGDTYEVTDNGRRLLLTGNVWSRFTAKAKQPTSEELEASDDGTVE